MSQYIRHWFLVLVLSIHVCKMQVFSVNLDDWTHEQVDSITEMGGNSVVNLKYEANIPDKYNKPNPNSTAQERTDFIRYTPTYFLRFVTMYILQYVFPMRRRKYELHEFFNTALHPPSSSYHQSCDKKHHNEKSSTHERSHHKKRSEHKARKITNSSQVDFELIVSWISIYNYQLINVVGIGRYGRIRGAD